MKILIVDDDPNISNILDIALSEQGYEITTLNDSNLAKDIIATQEFDLLMLDIMMPNVSGFHLCKHARHFTDNPILFITCLDDENSLISALDYGGDDYIKKPFNLNEVIARVNAHLRRHEIHKKMENQIYKTKFITFYASRNTVLYKDEKIYLSPLECDLLTYFFTHQNQIITFKELYEAIWHEPYIMDKSTIMTRVSAVRKKLPSLDITSVRGKGYQFNA
ncbi:response regulator transcription factor [Anaerovorax sp. IOR16]|uniref:response regulator transcription factor n=1 Tax=Anaerovorax sp. IOR16 TaxID=2773458 RepID=UPI0019D2238D|nr:response regulator transcription factor [Anaerovorax sp. IOR16]